MSELERPSLGKRRNRGEPVILCAVGQNAEVRSLSC